MTNNPNDKCAACGKLRSELPWARMEDGEEVQRFALFDALKSLWICSEDLDLYNAVQPLSSQWPYLADLPELQGELRQQVWALGERADGLFKKMTPSFK